MTEDFALMLFEKYERLYMMIEVRRWLTEPREDDGGI